MINIYKSQIGDLADQFLQAVEVRDRRYRLRILKSSFVGEEAVTSMINAGLVTTRSEAVVIGHRLQKELQLFSQPNGRPFKDDKLIYTVNYGNMTLGSWNHVDIDLLKENAYMFLQLVQLEDRLHFLKRYKDCFVGTDVVTSMVYSGLVRSRLEAVQLGRVLETKMKLFHGKHEFSDESHFYQLTPKGQKLMKKALKKAKTSRKNKSGPESDFQRKAIQHRIATQLEMDYSNRFLANVGEVNREMQERTKTMYTGHHEIVTGDDIVRKPTKKSRKKHAKKNKSMEMEMAVPTTVTIQRQRSSRSSTYSLMPSIREDDVIKEESFTQNIRCDEFSFLDEYSIADEDVYRYSVVDNKKPRFGLADSDVYTEFSSRSSGNKDSLSKKATSEWVEEIVEEEVTESTDEDSFESLFVEEGNCESSQESFRDIVLQDLWSDDIDVIQKALKELLERCNPDHGIVSSFRVLELGGIMVILHVIETYHEKHPSIAFLGCALLGRLYQASILIDTDEDDCVYDSDRFKSALFDMESMPMLLAIMNQERNRSVQAYQASRWLVNILYEDTTSY